MYYNNILETIGNTPLVRLNKVTANLSATILAKLEFFNPGNSIKDRMALNMVETAEKQGILRPGGTIVEATSGNTGMGLALVGTVKGYRCIFVIPDKVAKEKVDALKAMGAEVKLCPSKVKPEDPRSYYSVAAKLGKEIPNAIYLNQYFNLANQQAHYFSTGPEIWKQTKGKITHLVVPVGTGGTISGTGKYLKEQNPAIKIIGVDACGSALKKYHETGELDEQEIYSYLLEGVGKNMIPANIDFDIIDYFVKATDKDSAIMARRLAKEEGLYVGYSAGGAVQGVLEIQASLKPTDLVVAICHDHGSRYVSKIYDDEWMEKNNLLEKEPALIV